MWRKFNLRKFRCKAFFFSCGFFSTLRFRFRYNEQLTAAHCANRAQPKIVRLGKVSEFKKNRCRKSRCANLFY